ncbi:MAG TPA: peptide chain release factor N(5)-glutamine methyltransferase [Pirellulales bacterium]|jgi:release factor glutamine methyltransferase|nr:peptide chain release factor N(5)-glutamine methyltransferase [Pirellulales bacterium]
MSQSQSETWTIGRLLTWTADYLKQHGAASPRLDAEVLLAMAAGCQRIDLYTRFDEPAPDALRTSFRELVRRRAEGMPVAYLVGRREFYSLSFRVTPEVLIPRPETELLVVALLDRARPRAAAGEVSVADVGTGSGIIAICAAKYLPAARVTAIDVSPQALAVARANAEDLKVAERIELVEGDLLGDLPAEKRFDFIVSNPPYVSQAEYEALAPDVKQFEPRGALVAGPSGTEVIERLIPQARQRLAPGGMLLIEISPMLEQPVRALFEVGGGWRLEPTIKDLAGHARVIVAQAA